MLRRFSVDFALFSIVLDMVCVAIALSLASWLRQYLNTFPFVTYIPQPIVTPWALYLIFPILWVAILSLLSLYDNKRTRFAVPQGLTGWWQINGCSDKPMHLNTEEYIFTSRFIQYYWICKSC